MAKWLDVLSQVGGRLPAVGIVAFSGCSVNALAGLLLKRASHPTPMLWFAAALVELTTAWLVYQVVEHVRKVTKSNISKQDRRFYVLVLAAFAVLALPSLSLSVWANAREFGDVALGFVFPLLSVGCAVGLALPDTVTRHERRAEADRAEVNRQRAEARAEKDRKRAEAREETRRQQAESQRQQAESQRQQAEANRKIAEAEAAQKRLQRTLESLGSAAETLRQYLDNPQATQDQIADMLGTSERTVRNHLSRLENLGIVKRNGQGVELLVPLPEGWHGNGNGHGG